MDFGSRRSLGRAILVVDAVIVLAAMALAYVGHAALRPYIPALKAPPNVRHYAGLVVSALPMWLALIAALKLHRVHERRFSTTSLVIELGKLHAAGLVGLSAVLFLTQGVINRSLVGGFLLTTFVLLYLERWVVARWVSYQYSRGHGRERLLLVGAESPAMQRFMRAAAAADFPPEIVGRLGVSSSGASQPPADDDALPFPERLGHVDVIEEVLHDHPIDAVMFFPPLHEPEEAADALEKCETVGVTASFSLVLPKPHHATPKIDRIGADDFVTYDVSPKSPVALGMKHAVDVFATLVGVVLLTPVFVLVSLAILITMGRPIFFTQERAGKSGRPFRMIKFRSMVSDAEAKKAALREQDETGGPTFKMTDDPRVTRLGRFLRRTSIDELPQLFNVLSGAMSLVGPRPLPIDEQQNIHGWHRRRLSMKPGITCLWQVSGRSEIGFEEWMRLDLRYIDDWSPWLDVQLLFKTVPAVLFGRGAR